MATMCTKCKIQLPAGTQHCPQCGEALGLVVALPVASTQITTYAPGVVRSGPDPDTGEMTVRVDDPDGGQSRARHGKDGIVSIEIHGATGIGKRNEGRVAKTLRQRLAANGISVEIRDGRDDRGEDKILRIDDQELVLQITTAPAAPEFWREARLSSATTQVTEPHAAGWIRDPIVNKALQISETQRRRTVLAIDAHHVGVLALKPLVEAYLKTFAQPATEFSFSSVWVVGPTTQQCKRIGDGWP